MRKQLKMQWALVILAGIIAIAAVVVSLVAFWYVQHRQEPKPAPAIPCSTKEQRCIRIVEHDGKTFEFNDFQMFGEKCIAFRSLPDELDHYYCGEYELKWIGPENVRGTKV